MELGEAETTFQQRKLQAASLLQEHQVQTVFPTCAAVAFVPASRDQSEQFYTAAFACRSTQQCHCGVPTPIGCCCCDHSVVHHACCQCLPGV